MNRHPFGYLDVLSFLFFISLGFWIGKSMAAHPPVPIERESIVPTPSPLPSLPDGERILLLVGVDQINSQQPKLVSVWLLTYYLDNQPIQLLPIYPGESDPTSQMESELVDTFSIQYKKGSAQLDPAFLTTLFANNYWISGYLVLDNIATGQIIDLIGGLPNGQNQLDGAGIIQDLPDSGEQPLNALHQQTYLFGQACQTLAQLTQQPDLSQIVTLIPDHIFTDPQPHRLLSEINLLFSTPSLVRCEFPVHPSAP